MSFSQWLLRLYAIFKFFLCILILRLTDFLLFTCKKSFESSHLTLINKLNSRNQINRFYTNFKMLITPLLNPSCRYRHYTLVVSYYQNLVESVEVNPLFLLRQNDKSYNRILSRFGLLLIYQPFLLLKYLSSDISGLVICVSVDTT